MTNIATVSATPTTTVPALLRSADAFLSASGGSTPSQRHFRAVLAPDIEWLIADAERLGCDPRVALVYRDRIGR